MTKEMKVRGKGEEEEEPNERVRKNEQSEVVRFLCITGFHIQRG